MSKYKNYKDGCLAENDGYSTLSEEVLNEVAIQFNRGRNKKFGNVIILAGGAASGKGFVISNGPGCAESRRSEGPGVAPEGRKGSQDDPDSRNIQES